jgi:hypothetical protein
VSNRRWAIVAGLGIVELWIIGMMIRSVGGGPESVLGVPAAGGRTAKTLETGSAPQVVVVSGEAALTVSARPGTTVSVAEVRASGGWMQGSVRPVRIDKTSAGVRIVEPDGASAVGLGVFRRRLDVVVPPDARLEVQNAGSIRVSGLLAAATLRTDNGSIIVTDGRGALDVKTDDGRIELRDVDAPGVDVGSENGRVVFDRVRADRVAVVTDDGRVDVSRSLLRGGKIQTDAGRIRLGLDPRSDVTVSVRSAAGKVSVEPPLTVVRAGDDDNGPATIRVGNGAGALAVGSDDGSITVLAGGV